MILTRWPGYGSRGLKAMVIRELLRRRVWMQTRRVLPAHWIPLTDFVMFARHEHVVDILRRDQDFGVPFLPKMEALGSRFLLGLDRSYEYERQRDALRCAIRAVDLPSIERDARREAHRALSRCEGRVEIVTELTEPVLMHTIGNYLGTGTSTKEELADARQVFWDVFINPLMDRHVHKRADEAARRLRGRIGPLVRERRDAMRAGHPGGDVLGRLLQIGAAGDAQPLSDDEIIANLLGLLVAWTTSVSRTMAFTFDEILRFRRRDALARAQACAMSGDSGGVTDILLEAMRLQPSVPAIERVCLRDTEVAGKKIARDTKVMVALTAAMTDGKAIPHAGDFLIGRRDSAYLQYGWGLHTCLGQHVSVVQMSAIAMVLLSRPNLRRGSGLKLKGPYPRRLVLRFQ